MDADTRAMLRAYLDTFPVPPPVPVVQSRPGTAADLPMMPGPQPFNGGITPGYEPPRQPGEPATLADIAAAGLEATEDREWLRDLGRRLLRENWELARWARQLERTIDELKADRDVTPKPGDCGREGGGGESPAREAG